MDFSSLFETANRKMQNSKAILRRGQLESLPWEAQLIGIRGARGVGKTTLLLQRLNNLNLPVNKALYVSCDHLWLSKNSLLLLADGFVKQGGKFLFLDEVHKYPNWAQEIKNMYDDYPELKVVFTGSSMLDILNARADLSRRALSFTMQGLSYREYLMLVHGIDLPVLTLPEILSNHIEISREFLLKFKPLEHFGNYLKNGYYPYFQEVPEMYHLRIQEVVNLILEIELPLLRQVDVSYIRKLKQLLLIISESVPFVPNVSKLSERIGVNRNTFISYLHYLEEAGLTQNLYRDIQGVSRLQKPDKIYLENPNLHYALSFTQPNAGHIRECFFLNQVKFKHQIEFVDAGDFKVDQRTVFELGGPSKNKKQIQSQKDVYIVADNLEIGSENRIPLWLFGFLY
jgi:predicted AAA+ superfamily ATPase